MVEQAILPEARLLIQNISEYFVHSESGKALLAKAGGKIEEVSIFNPNTHVHCCELRPSYSIRFLYYVGHASEENAEAVNLELSEMFPDTDFSYLHCSSIKVEECELLSSPSQEEWDELMEEHEKYEQAENAWLEKQVEHYRCNCPY